MMLMLFCSAIDFNCRFDILIGSVRLVCIAFVLLELEFQSITLCKLG